MLLDNTRMRNSVDVAGIVLVVYVTFSSSTSQPPGKMSWLESYRYCQEKGETLPPRQTDKKGVWIFGLIVTQVYTDNGTRYIVTEKWRQKEKANKCCITQIQSKCAKINTNATYNFTGANYQCTMENKTMTSLVGQAPFLNFVNGNALGFHFWAKTVNVTPYFTADGFSLQCLLKDDRGLLRLDNCNTKHITDCVKDDIKPVFYLPNLNETVNISQYEPTPPNAGTTTNPPDSSSELTEGTGRSSVKTTPNTSNTNTKRPNDPGHMKLLSPDVVYTIAGMGAAVIITALIVAICCCCKRHKRRRTGGGTVVFDAYSDVLDSIAGKEDSNLNSVYAVPEDTLGRKKAKPRNSISEDEYDVLSRTPDRPPGQTTGNVYSHIMLGAQRRSTENTENIDDTYDVTNCTVGRGVTAKVTSCDTQENTYEHISKPDGKSKPKPLKR